jgi:hypothetical protein
MTPEQPRPDANSRDRSPDHQYTLSIDQVAEVYAKAGYPRTIRAIQKYCALDKLDCHKVETETGEKYLVAPYSVDRHIAYIKEVRTVASVRPLQNKDALTPSVEANSPEQSRTDATIRAADDRYIERLEGDIEFLRGQVTVKDGQIKELTERARETNVLIAGLQKMLTPLLNRPEERENGPQR